MTDQSDDDQSIIFHKINQLFGPVEVNLFASRLTSHTQIYFSWRPDPGVAGTDAFLSGLDFKEGLCKSTMWPTRQDFVLCSSSVSSNHSDRTCLEVPAMVSPSLGDGNRLLQVASRQTDSMQSVPSGLSCPN